MNALIDPLIELEAFESARQNVKQNKSPLYITGVVDSSKCHIIHALAPENTKIIITYSELKAKEIIEDMRFFEKERVMFYPSRDIIFYSADVHSNDIIRQRLEVIRNIVEGKPLTIVMSIEGLMDKIISKDIFIESIIKLEVGIFLKTDEFAKKLSFLGYERTPQVEGPGQFAIRGGIIDIYPIDESFIFRIELWGDEIDSIRKVNPESQRSIGNINDVTIMPAREIIVDDKKIKDAIINIKKDSNKIIDNFTSLEKYEEADRIKKVTEDLLTKVENLGNFNGIEANVFYYYDKLYSIIDYFEKPIIFLDEPVRIKSKWNSTKHEYDESFENRFEKGYLLPGQFNVIHKFNHISEKFKSTKIILLSTLLQKEDLIKYTHNVDFTVKSINPYHSSFDILKKDLKYLIDNKYRVLLLSASRTRAERMANLLNENNISAYFLPQLDVELPKGKVAVGFGSLHKGFEYSQIKFVVISESEIIGKKKKKRKQKKNKNGRAIDSFTDLRVGDYIVHENHGVGVFRGIEKIEIDGISKDFIKISYKDGGNLYITTNQLDVIQKYIGAEGKKPKLNKLGAAEWKKAKTRVKKEVEILAKDLVALYAKREMQEGYVYSEDTLWQKEFEEMFPFEETDDQVSAIEDTKKDMESTKIMDRLICGDVGYGKTEIAIRAAFKVVQDGKQVAYLVPTTILAQQHHNNFVQRMKDFPVRVEMLSRFKTAKEQKKIIDDLNRGLVDILIGTHRVLSKDVKYKDLGLLIVDEEQRFGVSHKEKIKKLKENIDVLTLTATPIPRTLHMSLIGIRDMSILEEPPEERQPIQTYVLEHNEELIKDAIYRELGRGGQVYYVYNRVKNIDLVATKISTIVPEANVAFAHGQMGERELENIMFDFINGDIDVLVSTTIIETGLDIQNVNTIIVENADRMGLSQLYQLRGRVGRSNRVAYAYLMYKKDKILQEIAEKRLQAIKEFTEFGSGFKIAMRDLEIRGAGNILGARQHGHMDAVGYDLYCKLLEEAVDKISNKTHKERFETAIELNVDAFIPDKYIKDEVRKIEAYKKIASIQNEEDYLDIKDELIDRYGDMPKAVVNLLDIALIKAIANQAEIISIKQKDINYILEVKRDAAINPNKIPSLVKKYGNKLRFTINERPYFTFTIQKNEKKHMFKKLKEIIIDIHHLKE